MKLTLSYSKLKLFKQCPKQYYYKYVMKLKEERQETKWCDFGSAMHEVLEFYYTSETNPYNLTMNMAREIWDKYKLEGRMDYTSFIDHVKNGINLYDTDNIYATTVEEKIFLSVGDYQFVAYLDLVNSDEDYIIDWKSGKYTKAKADDYKKQLQYYAYLYHRKYNRLPKKCCIYFNRENKMIEYAFDHDHIAEVEKEIISLGDQITEMMSASNEKLWDRNRKNCFFCGYKNPCQAYISKLDYKIVIANNYCFVEGDLTELLVQGLDKELSYDLKDKYWIQQSILQKQGGLKPSNYDDLGTKHLFNKQKKMFGLGHLNKVTALLKEYAAYLGKLIDIKVTDMRDMDVMRSKIEMAESLNTEHNLRPYQVKAIEAFIYHNGLGYLEMATGSGKTMTTAEIIRILRTKTLWIIDRKELLYQTKEEFEKLLNMEVGVIGDGKFEPKDVTVATIQTLAKHVTKHKSYLNSINFVVIDEAHHSAADTYQKVFKELRNTKYRLGTTATVKRDDGNEMILESLIGEVVYKIDAGDLIEQGYLEKPEIIFHNMSTIDFGSEEYNEVYEEAIVDNFERNKRILDLVDMDKKTLILTKRKVHAEDLAFKYGEYIHSDVESEKRAQIFKDFKSGKCNLLVSTLSIFAEGIDVPDLDMVINAAGNAGEVKTIQALGRVLRKSKDKKCCEYHDFIDDCKYMDKAAKSRMKILREQGYEVIVR